jgi:hypothetical protein
MITNCKQASFLISSQMDVKISLYQRAYLTWHLASCAKCRNFRQQLEFVRKSTHQLPLS